MKYDLAQLVRRTKNPRRKVVVLRPIVPPKALASDLYTSTYKRIIEALNAAIPGIVAAYERALPVRDGFADAADDVQPELESLGDWLRRLVLSLTPALGEWTVRVERWHRQRWRRAVLTATGVDIETMLLATGQPTSMAETVAWNVALLKDVSAQAQSRIGNAVFAAFQQRKPAADLARELRDIVDMSRRRSLGIAADQLQKLSGALDTERMADAGFDRWKYHHSDKLHPRLWHKAREGKIYDLRTNKEIDGPDQIKPGDGPTEPPFCGCKKQGVLVLN